MSLETAERQRSEVVTARQAGFFLVALCAVGGIAYALGGFRWLDFVALAGTAVGTLGLAFYTYNLARATQKAEQQTEALVRASQRQLEISAAEVAAAERTALEAARARIDASAPLLGMVAELGTMTVPGTTDGTPNTVASRTWTEQELPDLRVEAPITFQIINYGRSPALVSFPSLIPDPESLLERTGGSRQVVLAPGQEYKDVQRFHLNGRQAVDGVSCEIVVTCNGINSGSTFDTLRWRGALQPLRLEHGIVNYNKQIPLNAAPAQFVREYPSLDRPDEMREIAERIRLGK